jgi:hypothetical protein
VWVRCRRPRMSGGGPPGTRRGERSSSRDKARGKPTASSQNRLRLGEIRKHNALRAKSDFICRYKCTNTLPDIPQEPKLLKYPFDPMRYVKREAHGTGLEKAFNRHAPILSEPDLGVPIDLLDPEQYHVTGREPRLHPKDQELIDSQKEEEKGKETRAQAMPWFISTQYVDTNVSQSRKHVSEWEGDMTSPKGRAYMDALQEEESIDSRLEIADRTFADAAQVDELHKDGKLVHKDKPGVTSVEVMPLLPDVSRWGLSFVLTAFDEAPPQRLTKRSARDGAEIDPAGMPIIQGLQGLGDNPEQWMAYLMPLKRKEAAAEPDGSGDGDSAAASSSSGAADDAEEGESGAGAAPAAGAAGGGPAPSDESAATDGGGGDGNGDGDGNDPPIEYRRLRSYTFEKVAMGEVRDGIAGDGRRESTLIHEDSDSGVMWYKNLDMFYRLTKRRKTEDSDNTMDDRDSLLVRRHESTEAELEEDRVKAISAGVVEEEYDYADEGMAGDEYASGTAEDAAEVVKQEAKGEVTEDGASGGDTTTAL